MAAAIYTFLFTDIEQSSKRWEATPERMKAAVARHNEIVRRAVQDHGGEVFKSLGDGLAAVFETAHPAVLAALQMQRELIESEPGDDPVRTRIGLNSGSAEPLDGDYQGACINRAARINSLAHGGQVVLSDTLLKLAADLLPAQVLKKDLGEHALTGHARKERLWQVWTEGMPHDFPPLRQSKRRHNLTQLEYAFIGRKSERDEVLKRIHSGKQRLITIHGFGGMGKTTLANQVAWAALEDFPEGVVWVECESLRTEEDLAYATAHGLGTPLEASDPIEQVLQKIGEQAILMVFDCFEGLTERTRFLSELLKRCPNVQLLVTSRVLLGMGWEYAYELKGFSSKGTKGALPESLVLFQDAAQRARPEFKIDRRNRKLVADLVASLDSLPLAIVLVASRLRSLSLSELSELVQSSLLAAAKVSRDAGGRHDGLRRVIETSFRLLPPEERLVAAELSVFEGGFFLAQAREVLRETPELVDAVGVLREHSLLVAEPRKEGTRFRALDSVREYLFDDVPPERLRELRARHARAFLPLAGRIGKEFEEGDWGLGSRLLLSEQANLRRAVETAVEQDDQALLEELAWGLAWAFVETGNPEMLDSICNQIAEDRQSLLLKVLGLRGIVALRKWDVELAWASWDRRREIARRASQLEVEADTLADLINLAIDTDDPRRASDGYARLTHLVKKLSGEAKMCALAAMSAYETRTGALDRAQESLDASFALLDDNAQSGNRYYLHSVAVAEAIGRKDRFGALIYSRKLLEQSQLASNRYWTALGLIVTAEADLALHEGELASVILPIVDQTLKPFPKRLQVRLDRLLPRIIQGSVSVLPPTDPITRLLPLIDHAITLEKHSS